MSDEPVPVAATLEDAAADPALTLDVARELLRDAAAGIRRLAAKPAEGREECPWGGCGDCVGHEATQPAGDGARKVVAWARPVFVGPLYPKKLWEECEMVDIEFHLRPEKPEGIGWFPLVVDLTGSAP